MKLALSIVLGLSSLACGGDDRNAFQIAQEEGVYCCTTNGTLETDGDARCPEAARNVEVYQIDFRDVDPSGRGRMCGWWL